MGQSNVAFAKLTKMARELLDELPRDIDPVAESRACQLMNGIVLLTEEGREPTGEDEHEMVIEIVRLMHGSAHRSPRLTALLALNCLTQLDLLGRAMNLPDEKRTLVMARLMQTASQTARDHIMLSEGLLSPAGRH